MNNKGFIGLLTYFLVAFFVISIGLGIIYVQNVPQAEIQNVTSKLIWKDVEQTSNSSIVSIIYKNVNAIGFSAMEVAKQGVLWGAEHPETNWKLLVWLVMIAILSPIIVSLLKIIIIVVIFIRDFIQTRKEKRRIKLLRKQNEK